MLVFQKAIGPYDFPLNFTVNSDIYFGIRAVGGGSNTRVFTVRCSALSSDDQSIEDGYDMITEGCGSCLVNHNSVATH